MSYGWLTESALMPKPSKKINVEGSSLMDLTVMLEKERKKRETQSDVKLPSKKVFVATNKGIEARNRKDLELATADIINGQARLEEKAKIYETLMNTKNNAEGNEEVRGKYLVDFDAKKFENMTHDEKEEFEYDKQRFYEEQARLTREREENISGRRGKGEMNNEIDERDAERMKWEAQVLRDIGEGVTEEMREERKDRVFVRQSYDKIASNQEKEKLTEVLKEEEHDKKTSTDIKKKREELQRLRQEKLKKLSGQANQNVEKAQEGAVKVASVEK